MAIVDPFASATPKINDPFAAAAPAPKINDPFVAQAQPATNGRTEDHGWLAETGRSTKSAIEAIGNLRGIAGRGQLEGLAATGRAAMAVPELIASPLTGAVRSYGGRAIQSADQLLRKGAVKLYGEDRVPPAMTFDEAAGRAEQGAMLAPGIGMASRAGALGGLRAAPEASSAARGAIDAFHGSPDSIGKFSLDRADPSLGGLNFTRDEDTARHYAGDTGTVHKVRLHIDPDHVLHWNKPFSEQSEFVKSALASTGKTFRGAQIGEDLFGLSMKKIRDLGIKAVEHEGEGGQITIFDDSGIEITHKNGQPTQQSAPPAPPSPPLTAAQAAKNAFGLVEKLFSPETVDANARSAAAMIREMTGKAARDTATTSQALESSWKTVNAMPAQDNLNFIDYVEGRSTRPSTQPLSPELHDLADKLRGAFEERMAKIQALPAHQQQAFVEDYFPHFWKEPGAAANAQPVPASGGMGKQGSGASLKKRTVPTIADGIAQGLTPVTTNPLEATMRYVTSMDRFIASEEVKQTAVDQGLIKWVKPKIVGASGHPESFKVPPGYVALQGRGATNGAGATAYAPEGFATVYNNFISRGIAEHGEAYGTAYEGMRRASNAVTAMELGASGYHFLTVSKAALDNSMANAINLMRKGHPIQATKQVLKTPLAPIRYALSGREVKNAYLGISTGSRELEKTVDMLTRAGGRAVGRSHAPEYEFSTGGSYVTAIKRGALKIQFAADRAQARGSQFRAFGEARFAAKQVGRIMDTIAAPLFEQYIPAVKNGAFRENLGTWLQSNPNATEEQTLHAARQIWDSVDDRFGEMVQDNIFMNKIMKQVGMLMLRSWSWTVGQDVRMLGGAARDVARAPFKKVTGTGPNDTRWTQKMDMAIAMPIVYGTLAAIYQGIKTGKPPEDTHDLAAPRTGGTDPVTRKPERLLIPGPEKDVMGGYEHFGTTAGDKLATGPKALYQLWNNEDFRNDPILPGDARKAPPWLWELVKYLGSDMVPISVRGLTQGAKKGSNIGGAERLMGMREAPRYLTDPEGYEKMMKSIATSKWHAKEKHDLKQQRFHGD